MRETQEGLAEQLERDTRLSNGANGMTLVFFHWADVMRMNLARRIFGAAMLPPNIRAAMGAFDNTLAAIHAEPVACACCDTRLTVPAMDEDRPEDMNIPYGFVLGVPIVIGEDTAALSLVVCQSCVEQKTADAILSMVCEGLGGREVEIGEPGRA